MMPFSVGRTVGGATVLERLTDPKAVANQADMFYRVLFLCCNQIGVIDQRRLSERERRIRNKDRYGRPMKNCILCAPTRHKRQKRDREASVKAEAAGGVYDLRGQWWPFLRGPMGPRWGTQNPTVMRKEQ